MQVRDTQQPSILAERAARLPVAGKIRTGVKILTRTAAALPRAQHLFDAGVAAGKSYETIEKDIMVACELTANPLQPRNTPHFRVARRDFTMPEVADRILALYAEDRGQGPQLYRFPIILPFDNWLDNLPHGMRAFTKAGLKYWSEYDQAGIRFCQQYAAPELTNQKAVRAWGGRRAVLRADNEGRCAPERCAEYQRGECKLSGRLLFYIPGVPGASLIELDTTSFYSLSQWRAQLELVYRIRHGRIAGTYQGRPLFYLTKREEQVAALDDQGQPIKRRQFLVKLEADVQMGELLAAQEALVAAPLATEPDVNMPVAALPPQPETSTVTDASPAPVAVASSASPARRLLREEVYAMLQALPLERRQAFTAKMEDLFGTGWTKDSAALTDAKFELQTS